MVMLVKWYLWEEKVSLRVGKGTQDPPLHKAKAQGWGTQNRSAKRVACFGVRVGRRRRQRRLLRSFGVGAERQKGGRIRAFFS